MSSPLNFLNAGDPEALSNSFVISSRIRNALAVGFGLGILIASIVTPSAVEDHRAAALRAILETSIALVGTLVAILAFGRFRRSGGIGDLAILCGVALLAWVHTLFGTVPDLISPYSVGNGVSERVELWGTVVVRTVAAGFLVLAAEARTPLGGGSPTRPLAHPERHVLLTLGAAAVVVTLLVWLAPIDKAGLLSHVSWPQSFASVLLLVDALLFFVASFQLSRRASAQSDPFLGWIGTGCVLAGFAMTCYALLPAGNPDWLRAGDVLRAAAVVTWATGAVREILSYWSNLAEAARKQARLDVAVDLHDGLAQELALLATYTYESPDVRARPEWHQQLQATAVRALAEARRAILALTTDRPMSFQADLERTAESISGDDVEVCVEVGPSVGIMTTDPMERESIVRIVREAVTNAVRHGSASRIDIVFEADDSRVLRVVDDGVGFDPARTSTFGRFGLASMRETAGAIGASVAVRSAPGHGTTVEVLWP
jgi:signal transduction histidine kinase